MEKNRNNERLDRTILRTSTNYLLPLLILFSIFLLIRGHYLSGGGFVGGLVASIAFVLHSFAYSPYQTVKMFAIKPFFVIPTGLIICFLSGLLPVLLGYPFMSVVWFADSVVVIGALGSALIFDIGVYMVVIGVVLTILFTISENT
ncbi:Na(+)/H(+) antiporter subunit B [Flavobacterium sp. CBA20B-1]|uniref:Na(+)/H(+) antiporter subunit B n=1 Tax=Paenimyroides aestuarii TaxID=2968490 RepID=A0ABY5NR49_9FLAO|nr:MULTISPECIES: MnhB domain-containing protein [Flavobacteriaceae]UUV21040.1 Na(+)/H(+) antiporter subunit B [Paenimyroides aestuarii]WCM42849.1 Na(+)/H(+) antiporter subunit B [Flavobacterium sp. CBA20B-1]